MELIQVGSSKRDVEPGAWLQGGSKQERVDVQASTSFFLRNMVFGPQIQVILYILMKINEHESAGTPITLCALPLQGFGPS